MNESNRKPNLFVIGAMKCGTTSLHEYLNTHPQIAMSRQKEPAYFVEELTMRRGESWYLGLFESGARYRYIGESSTQYTMLPTFQGVPERIFRFNPEARLIYIMRNPFERTLSHYWHAVRVRNWKTGSGEPRPLVKAVREEPKYLAYSDYATQLEPYIERFGRQAVYTLTFESLTADPQRELDRIYEWLGLPQHPLGDQAEQAHNQRPKVLTVAAGAGILYRIRFSKAWHRWSSRVPGRMRRWARRLAETPIDEKRISSEIASLRSEIGEQQRLQVARLARLLGRDFPEWIGTIGESANNYATARVSGSR